MKLRDKKILTQDEYRRLLREIGPAQVTRTTSEDGPTITKIAGSDHWITSHYLMDDLDAYTYKELLGKLPEPVLALPPVLNIAPEVFYVVGKTFNSAAIERATEVTIYKAGTEEEVELNTISMEQAGNYDIVAKNTYGEVKGSFKLNVIQNSTFKALDSQWNTSSLEGNKLTYTGKIHKFTREDGLETYPAGTYLTGFRVGTRVETDADTLAAMSQYSGIVRFGGKEWTTRDAFAVANPEVEIPSFSYWPCVDTSDFKTQIVVDWLGNGDPNTTETFEIVCDNVTFEDELGN